MEKKKAETELAIVSARLIERRILFVRGEKVLLDSDLAELYGISTRVFNQAVKRNIERFPLDFMFRLNQKESFSLISQFVTSKGRGGRRKPAYVFTEQGVAMLSSVLNSERAVAVNIEIMRTFVKIRELLITHKDLAEKLQKLEEKYDEHFKIVFDAIRQLMTPPEEPNKTKIGFNTE